MTNYSAFHCQLENKSGRCAPYKSQKIRSYECKLSRADIFGFVELRCPIKSGMTYDCWRSPVKPGMTHSTGMTMLLTDAKSANRQIVNGLQSGFQQNMLKVDTNIVLYQNLVKDTILQI